MSAVAFVVLLPVAAFAADLNTGANNIIKLIQTATRAAYMLAFLAFFWGLAMFLFNAGNEEKRKKGMGIIIWSIVAIFVMTSIWGIVYVLRGTLGADTNSTGDMYVPGIQFGQ